MATNPCCPTCGRAYPKPKVPKAAAVPVDTSALPDAELIAYFKRIGAREDVRFFLRQASYLTPEHRAEGEALLAELSTRDSRPADRKRLEALQLRARSTWQAVCGHTHHTSLGAAMACKLDLLDCYLDRTDDYHNEAQAAVYQALGWDFAAETKDGEPTGRYVILP